jgi:hypothetical protein
MKRFFAVLLFCVLFSGVCHAQAFGSIVGTISDPQGASVPSATIVATQVGTNVSRSTTSSSEGYFVLDALSPAEYSISIQAQGFQTNKQDITLLANQTITLNQSLSLGANTETVSVSGTTLQVDTSTGTLGQVVENTRVQELPLNGRNVAQLTLTVAGVVNAPNGGADQGTTKTFPGAVTYSTNGTRQNTIAYTLDGANYIDEYTNVNQPFPFPDNLQEFSVQTSNYSAQYGQNAGAVVNVVTKSGTNDFHGDLFEYIRNPIFNAQNFFATPTTKDQIKRNQFGGTIGGPIIHNKTYFFAGYQRTPFRNLNVGSSSVVGQTDITDFLAPKTVACPTCGAPTTAATGPAGIIDPAIATMVGINPATGAYLGSSAKFSLAGPPPAGVAQGKATTAFLQPISQNFDSGMGRVDQTLTKNDRLTGRYEYDRFTQAPVFNPVELVAYKDATLGITAQNLLVQESHIFTARSINDFRFSFSRENSTRGPAPTAVAATAFGISSADNLFEPTPSAIQGIGVQSGFAFGDNPHGVFYRRNVIFADDISWTKGKHDIHFGGSIERSHVNLTNQFNQPGLFGFGNQDQYLFGSSTFATYQLFLAGILSDGSGTGNGFAFQQGSGEFKQNFDTFTDLYIQDNIRVNRRLTVNLGLRWEPALPWRDQGDRWAQVNLPAMAANRTSIVYPNAPPGIFFSAQNGIPSDPGMPKNALNPVWDQFNPRVGFAWDVFGDGKTSVRAGAGIFSDTRVMGMLSNRFVDEWPFSPQFILSSATSSAPTPGSAPGSFSDPLCQLAATKAALNCSGTQKASYPTVFPAPFPAPTNTPYNPPFNEIAVTYNPTGVYQVPTVYAYNISIEHQMPWSILGRIAYVGSHSDHILETQFYNYSNPVLTTGQQSFNPLCKSTTGLADCTVFVGSGGKFLQNTFSNTVQADINDVNANYNGLQLSIERRAAHGLTVLANYTYSRSLDDLPFGEGVSGFDTGYSALPLNNPNRHRFDYGPSGFDHTHVFVTSLVWQSPSLGGSNALVHHLLGNWEYSLILSVSSGGPTTILQGTNISGTNIGNDRATYCTGSGPSGDTCTKGASAYTSSTTCSGVTVKCYAWFSTGAFEPTKVGSANNSAIFGTFGNVSKNSLRLPTTQDWDMSLSKYINFTERWRLQFRADFFNAFNHPSFAPVSTSTGAVNGTDSLGLGKLSSGTFGDFTAGQAGDPRVIQLALKLLF